MDNAVLNSELITTRRGVLPSITMMVRRGNIFLHQLNILQWVSVFQHIPV